MRSFVSRWLRRKPTLPRPVIRFRRPLEALEDRMLLTGGLAQPAGFYYDAAKQDLVVVGTAGNNQLEVRYLEGASNTVQLRLITGTTVVGTYKLTSANRPGKDIIFQAGAGNDTFTNQTL